MHRAAPTSRRHCAAIARPTRAPSEPTVAGHAEPDGDGGLRGSRHNPCASHSGKSQTPAEYHPIPPGCVLVGQIAGLVLPSIHE